MPPEADIVKEIDLGIDPEDGAPMPVLLQDDLRAFLLFYAVRRTAEGRWEDAGVAILEFEHCMITKFGYPNDEALWGHPLHFRGLGRYACLECSTRPGWRR